MDNLTDLAISKFKLDKKIRGDIKPGSYDVDVDVNISGTIKVGADYEQNVTAKVKWQKLVVLLMSKVNGATIEKLVRELDENNDISDEAEKSIADRAQAALDAIVEKTKSPCKGKVTAKLKFTENVTAS